MKAKPKRINPLNRFGEPSVIAICMNWFNGYDRKYPKDMGNTEKLVKCKHPHRKV